MADLDFDTRKKAAKNMPADYTGSAQNVSTFTDSQDAIKAQMNANSLAWYGASAEEQERLHRENQILAAQLGGSVSFDAGTGAWSGMADLPGAQTGQVEDYSAYLQQMYAAQKAASLSELKNAYEQNVNAIERAGEGVSAAYQNARSSAAGASELSARNFNEYAAASGLNSGTGGQAELARGVTLQNNLNSIDTAEADTVADLELQRANAETEYNNAIARAEATGDYELASALYQEKVRVQNALLDLAAQQQQYALQKYQLEYQAQRDQVGDRQWASELAFQQQKYGDSLAQSRNEDLAGYGYAFLKQGVMPSAEMLSAMGITQADAQTYIAALQAQTGGAGGGSGGSGTSSGGTMTLTTAKQAASKGVFNDQVLSVLRANGYTDDMLEAIYGYTSASDSGTGMNEAYFTAAMRSIAGALASGKPDSARAAADQIWDRLSAAQKDSVNSLLAGYGGTLK